MKNNEPKRMSFLIEEEDQKTEGTRPETRSKMEKLKKPIIFVLMGIAFLGCLYLIFQPSDDDGSVTKSGLNVAVPQAANAVLQSDKQKAYEQEMMRQKAEEKRKQLATLADYWNSDSAAVDTGSSKEEAPNDGIYAPASGPGHPGLYSYRNAQEALDDFYKEDQKYIIEDLNEEIAELKEQLAQKQTTPNSTVQDQLALMEKSYEMAAKYLPSSSSASTTKAPDSTLSPSALSSAPKVKQSIAMVSPHLKGEASNLQWLSEKGSLPALKGSGIRHFNTTGVKVSAELGRNSLKAVVVKTTTVTDGASVSLCLLDEAQIPEMVIAAGTLLSARARFNQGRSELSVSSIGYKGNIIAVELSAYDLDGQLGLLVPYSPEMNALSSMAANMSQSSGSSLMMTRSAGQQLAGDLSRGIVQGISGYFSKKVSTPKVTIKAGHQLFLKSKN